MLIISGDFHSGSRLNVVLRLRMSFQMVVKEMIRFGLRLGFVKQMADKTNGYGEHIIRDKRICGGEPVFKGTRVTLRTVLASLAAGEKVETILEQFPTLKAKHVRAAIAFAAASAEEDLPVPETPHVR